MPRIKVKVDFDRLLEDITYTNWITKNVDVSGIITRNQYYQLKDSLVIYLLKNGFTENTVDGFEYVMDKEGNKIWLVRLSIRHGETICMVHQNFSSRLMWVLGLDGIPESGEEYMVKFKNGIEFDEARFRESIANMKASRIRFMRESLNNNAFESGVSTNSKSNDPWMKCYLSFLPLKGKVPIRIVDSGEVISNPE